MLQNTFLHIPGIGIKFEQALWEKDIQSRDDLLAAENIGFSPKSIEKLKDSIRKSQEPLHNENRLYFADTCHTTWIGDSFPISGSQRRIWI